MNADLISVHPRSSAAKTFFPPTRNTYMMNRLTALVLSLVISVAIVPRPIVAQQPAPAATATDYSAPLAAIEKAIDEKRKEFGIPGASLAIVKDDKVINLKGLGVKDFEHNK